MEDKVRGTNPKRAVVGTAAVPAALAMLKNPVASTTKDIITSAQTVYASACTPANTMLIKQAVEHVFSRDPKHKNDPEILAFDAHVRCCDYLNRWNGADDTELEAAERAAETALSLTNRKHRRALYVSAFLHRARGNHAESLDAFNRVIKLKRRAKDRMAAVAYAQSGAQEMYLGHPEKTRELVYRAIAMTRPDSPALGVFYWIAGRVPFIQGNYGEAINWLERSLAIRPNFWYTRAWLIAAYALIGRSDAAREALIGFRTLFPQLNSIAAVTNAEGNIAHTDPLLIDARKKVHDGLMLAGLPA
jgi:tetratricopeptide (TPR) repeat protein